MTAADTWDPPPWEPPLAGTEIEALPGALERLRTTFRWKADGLDATGLQTRIGASTLTIGGLLKHLAAAEDYMFTTKMRGEPMGAPWEPGGTHANLRRLVCDLLEEYGRHTGHADLIREAVDGLTGEDPPEGWRPISGRPETWPA